jgi:vesicle coat complex subunit
MHTFLVAESDSACKRNAFVFLAHCSMPKAVEYILSIYDSIGALLKLFVWIAKTIQAIAFVYFYNILIHWTHLDSSQDIFVASSNTP